MSVAAGVLSDDANPNTSFGSGIGGGGEATRTKAATMASTNRPTIVPATTTNTFMTSPSGLAQTAAQPRYRERATFVGTDNISMTQVNANRVGGGRRPAGGWSRMKPRSGET